VILPDGHLYGIQCVGGRGLEILMYSLLQIGRSYRERADPPMLLLADFMCSEVLCPTQKARVEWVRLIEKHRILP